MRRTLVRPEILLGMCQLPASIQSAIKQKLSNHQQAVGNLQFLPIGGGSINETYRITGGSQLFFCKLNSATKYPQLFIKEKNGLDLIAKQNIIKIPAVIDCFQHEDTQLLLLEWIGQGERTEAFWKKFGEQLAAMHQQSNEFFGLEEDNYMGSVPQCNRQHQSWNEFLAVERLLPMVKKCYEKHLLTTSQLPQFESLVKKLDSIFEIEKPCLLHGDLWSGNFMCDQNSEPVLIDPAVYYGHLSIDLGMTTLFGGFRQPFYEAYHYQFPFPPNYKEQWEVCNLYPLLIHLYLFGSSYLSQIESSLRKFT